MGTQFHVELLPRKPLSDLSKESFAAVLDLLHRSSGGARSTAELSVVEPGSANKVKVWPESLEGAAGAVRGLQWDRVEALKLIQKNATPLGILFTSSKGGATPMPFNMQGLRVIWNPVKPRELDPVGDQCQGYVPTCRNCRATRPIALAKVLHVHAQKDRWKCPACEQVAGVDWRDDAETLAFTRPFSLGFRGPGETRDVGRPCIQRRDFAEELEVILGFSVREWFTWS